MSTKRIITKRDFLRKAGVTGAGLVTLAASLAAFDSIIPLAGIALIVGIDRFMSEARALTNLTGNGIGTLVVARWTGQLDRARLREVLENPQIVNVDQIMQEQLTSAQKPAIIEATEVARPSSGPAFVPAK